MPQISKITLFLMFFWCFSLPANAANDRASNLNCSGAVNIGDETFDLETKMVMLLKKVSPKSGVEVRKRKWEKCKEPNCLKMSSPSAISYIVRTNPAVSQPQMIVDLTSNSKTLETPSANALNGSLAERIVRQWIIGDSLHPYHQRGFVGTTTSSVEKQALRAFQKFRETPSKRSLLHVSPVAATEKRFITNALFESLKASGSKTLSIVTSDQAVYRRSLVKEIGEAAFAIEGSEIENAKDFEEKLVQALKGSEKVVLTISAKELKSYLEGIDLRIFRLIADNLEGVYMDNALHLEPKDKDKLYSLYGNSKTVFLYALTSTPAAYNTRNLNYFFEMQHWAYLNSDNNSFEKHSDETVSTQLLSALQQGDVVSVDTMSIVGRESFDIDKNGQLFERNANGYFVFNPNHYQTLTQLIAPVMNRGGHGFIKVAHKEELSDIMKLFEQAFPGINFVTQYTPQNFQTSKSKRQFLLAAEESEHIDWSRISTYIDLTEKVILGEWLDALGRVLSPAVDKITANTFSIADYSDKNSVSELNAVLDVIASLTNGNNMSLVSDNTNSAATAALVATTQSLKSQIAKFWTRTRSENGAVAAAKKSTQYFTMNEFLLHIHREKISTIENFKKAAKGIYSQKLPKDPEKYYGDDWVGWGRIFQPATFAAPSPNFENRSIEEFAAYFYVLFYPTNVKKPVTQAYYTSVSEKYFNRQTKFYDSSKLPGYPQLVFKDSGWKGWSHFNQLVQAIPRTQWEFREWKKTVLDLGFGKSIKNVEFGKDVLEKYDDLRRANPFLGLPAEPVKEFALHGLGELIEVLNKPSDIRTATESETAEFVRSHMLDSKESYVIARRTALQETGIVHPRFPEFFFGKVDTWKEYLSQIGIDK